LVAKEFVASREDLDGVLVLSRFAGAAVELSSGVLVNPFSEEDVASGIHTALTLPRAQRMVRMSRMRSAVRDNDIHRWAADVFSAAVQAVGGAESQRAPAAGPPPRQASAAEVFCS
jgi:trehalose-6-phosphate synthase